MPKIVKQLNDCEVDRIKLPTGCKKKLFAVGGVSGLSLQIMGNSKCWILRTMRDGKRCEYGLGSYPEVLVNEARKRALEHKVKLYNGQNPKSIRKHYDFIGNLFK